MRNSIVYAHFARRAAVLIIANSMVGRPLPSFFTAEYHVYVLFFLFFFVFIETFLWIHKVTLIAFELIQKCT